MPGMLPAGIRGAVNGDRARWATARFWRIRAGQAMLKAPAPHATLGQPGVLRAAAMAGAYPALIALISLGIGAIIRHTAGAICALVGVVFVLPLLLFALGSSIQNTADRKSTRLNSSH